MKTPYVVRKALGLVICVCGLFVILQHIPFF